MSVERRLSAILAADVVSYSRMLAADEAGTLEALRLTRVEVVEPSVATYGGRIFSTAGDGVLAEFRSAVDAMRCAMEIQSSMAARGGILRLRLGVNVGDVVLQDGDILGDGVNIAARLEAAADPGGIAMSGAVREYVLGRINAEFRDGGLREFKNIDRPIQVWHWVPGNLGVSMAPPASSAKPSIAVLPFTNMSGDPEQEYFSDGISEDLITDLSKISALNVVARNTVFAFKGAQASAQEIASRLGARYILEGSVRKAGNRVRVTSQLIDGRNGYHLWADRYDRDLTDIFAIQDEVTRTIVAQLKVAILPEERDAIGRAPTDSVEAYTYYLRGRQFAHIWTKSYLLLARRMFERALELDARFARAYAGIADCDTALQAWHGVQTPIEPILSMSDRALALDPSLAEAHASRGFALHITGRHVEAVAEFERALALAPDLYETHFFYGRACFTQGELEKAALLFERAADIRADDYRSCSLLAMIYQSLGREADRTRVARRGIERAERMLNLHPENAGPAVLGAVSLAHLGEWDRAREWAARALAIEPDDRSTQYNLACVYSLIGDLEVALDLLEKSVASGTLEQALWIPQDSDLAPLRGHPRYARLLDAIEAARRSGATAPAVSPRND